MRELKSNEQLSKIKDSTRCMVLCFVLLERQYAFKTKSVPKGRMLGRIQTACHVMPYLSRAQLPIMCCGLLWAGQHNNSP